jgi:hypothetical protein
VPSRRPPSWVGILPLRFLGPVSDTQDCNQWQLLAIKRRITGSSTKMLEQISPSHHHHPPIPLPAFSEASETVLWSASRSASPLPYTIFIWFDNSQCCTRVENSRRESRSRENIFVSKGLVRLATSRFARAVSSARSAAANTKLWQSAHACGGCSGQQF